MTENNDLFDMFDKEAEHNHDEHVSLSQVDADIKVHDDETAPPLPPVRRREVRERKKKLKQQKRRRIIISILVCVLIIGIGFGGYAVMRGLRNANIANSSKSSTSLDYPGPGEGSVIFTVEQGQGTDAIAQNLVKEDIVRSTGAFTQAVETAQAANKLQAGSFELKKKMAAADVVAIITDPSKITGSLVVKPGERVSAVLAQAAELSGISSSEFDAIVSNGGDGILPSAAQGNFEGWFEPGTYNVKSAKSASEIISAMVEKRIAKLKDLGVSDDLYETVLNKASIVEGEVNKAEYYGKVARVIENRLAINMPLGMDSVIAYGLGINARELTVSQLQDSSNAYNDRIHAGLPPTPINNPGDNAIQAVLSPEEGNWLYFVTVNLDTGETKFTDNEDEFQQYAQEYQQWEAAN
ncbi:endolytic transglycosylase MltG [Alloscardovia theropitheci]|uniref:Endolytic murein transglycosylase n=1 Tax=Alloscardovia theropitheci TaxID=2496842 RepID=A0A4R0QRQ4_9BIFI|nr:endolytic transglycosylase MltG [Alloscardovia theropitheci]TCD55062.1 endolytic transglycosylase MltG [Alloscardovia theropitheci]